MVRVVKERISVEDGRLLSLLGSNLLLEKGHLWLVNLQVELFIGGVIDYSCRPTACKPVVQYKYLKKSNVYYHSTYTYLDLAHWGEDSMEV